MADQAVAEAAHQRLVFPLRLEEQRVLVGPDAGGWLAVGAHRCPFQPSTRPAAAARRVSRAQMACAVVGHVALFLLIMTPRSPGLEPLRT